MKILCYLHVFSLDFFRNTDTFIMRLLKFNIIILCFLGFLFPSCCSIPNSQQIDDNYYFLDSTETYSVFLYWKSYFSEDYPSTIHQKTFHLSDNQSFVYTPNYSVLPKSKSFEITEFSILKINSSLYEKNSFILKKNRIIFDDKKFLNDNFVLLPVAKKTTSGYEFGLFLIKLQDREEHLYFPGSERLRIEISDKKGKLIWNSNYNKSYLTVVGELLPKEKYEYQYYSIEWNRIDNWGNELSSGDYLVNFVLPLQPNNLSIVKTIYLE